MSGKRLLTPPVATPPKQLFKVDVEPPEPVRPWVFNLLYRVAAAYVGFIFSFVITVTVGWVNGWRATNEVLILQASLVTIIVLTAEHIRSSVYDWKTEKNRSVSADRAAIEILISHVGDTGDSPDANTQVSQIYLYAKRLLDVILAMFSLITLWPLMALFSLAVKLDSPGPILYRSPRLGLTGRPFIMYQFRTMVVSAAEPEWKGSVLFDIPRDPRMTRVGAYLHKSHLAYMPQLWNVLRGEMSMVGPRPLLLGVFDEPEEFEIYTSVKPGMTGLWTETDLRFNDPAQLATIQMYRRKASLWLDIQVLFKAYLKLYVPRRSFGR